MQYIKAESIPYANEVQEMLRLLMNFIGSAPIPVQIVSSLLLCLVVVFVFRFCVPAAWLWLRFSWVILRLTRARKAGNTDLKPIFSGGVLSHLWTEYHDTLHEQREFDHETSAYKPAILRSTVPAGTIFTTETLVDARLATEFFKHLPGIFTGLGIIGTFSGLINGLQDFKVTENPSEVRTSLGILMQGVHEAFAVSAVAIAAAMLATLVEKFLVALLYRRVERITFELDAMFASGAGEEYLARLVKASEDAADQSKILKDALITDLKAILEGLTERQIEVQTQGNRNLVEGLTSGLQKPLDQIADTFKHTSKGNEEAVGQLLADVLAGFGQRMQDLFGGQIAGINQLQQQTIESLTSAVAKLEQMGSSISDAGAKTSDAMEKRLAAAMDAMEARQTVLNDRMGEFVEQIRNSVSASQTEAHKKLEESLSQIAEAARLQIAAIQEQGAKTSASQSEREERMSAQTQEMMRQLGAQIDAAMGSLRAQTEAAARSNAEQGQRLATETDGAIAKLAALTEDLTKRAGAVAGEVRSAVEAMRGATIDASANLNRGVDLLLSAANRFAQAGQDVAGVLDRTGAISERLSNAAGSVSQASAALQGVVADHAATRTALADMLTDLRATIENARKEAALTEDILSRIEAATEKLGKAQQDVGDYLDGISDVLAQAHNDFSEGVKKVLGDGHRDFYDRLSSATGLLRTAIEELASAVEPVPAKAGR